MSTIAPDQLPVPTAQQAVVPPAPVWADSGISPTTSFHSGVTARRPGRSSIQRLAIAGVATLVVALSGAGMVLRGGGAAEERSSGRNAERDDRNDSNEPTNLGDQPDTPDTTDGSGAAGSAGNVSVDYAATYQTMLGAAPSAATLACIAEAATAVESDVAAMVTGTATTYGSVVAGMSPFAGCAPAEDFAAAIVVDIQAVFTGASIDQGCVIGVLDTFTAADRLDAMATAYVDLNQYAQGLSDSFAGCTF